MVDLYKPKLTAEEQRINDALDKHLEAVKDEGKAWGFAVLLYAVGFVFVIASSKDSRPQHVGNALFMCGLFMVLINILLGFRTRKYRREAKELVDPYMRRKAIPFYQELTQMFAEEPGVHLHLNQNGSITVTDRRKGAK